MEKKQIEKPTVLKAKVKTIIRKKQNPKLAKYENVKKEGMKVTSIKMTEPSKKRLKKTFGSVQTAMNILATPKGIKALEALIQD